MTWNKYPFVLLFTAHFHSVNIKTTPTDILNVTAKYASCEMTWHTLDLSSHTFFTHTEKEKHVEINDVKKCRLRFINVNTEIK